MTGELLRIAWEEGCTVVTIVWWLYDDGETKNHGMSWLFKDIVDWPPKQSGRVEFHRCPSQNTVLSPDIKAPLLHLNLTKIRWWLYNCLRLYYNLLRHQSTSVAFGWWYGDTLNNLLKEHKSLVSLEKCWIKGMKCISTSCALEDRMTVRRISKVNFLGLLM